MAARTGAAFPGGLPGGRLQVVAADLAVAGFGVDVVDRWGDGQPGVLAVTSRPTGACAEVAAYGAELELRCSSGPGDAAGLVTARVCAVLAADAADDAPGGLPGVMTGQRAAERRALLVVILRAELAVLGVRAWPQPGGQSLGIWPGLFAGVSQDAAWYGWTTGTTAVCTHPAGDAGGAARRIARHGDVLAGGGGRLA
jgi:hypothetical protein